MHAPRRAASVDASTRARAARKSTNKHAQRAPLRCAPRCELRCVIRCTPRCALRLRATLPRHYHSSAPLHATRSAARWVLRTRAPRSVHHATRCAPCCALHYALRTRALRDVLCEVRCAPLAQRNAMLPRPCNRPRTTTTPLPTALRMSTLPPPQAHS